VHRLVSTTMPRSSGRDYRLKAFTSKLIQRSAWKGFSRKIVCRIVHRGSRSQFMRGLLAARLEPEKRYDIWWFNRRHYASKQAAVNGPGARTYRRQFKVTDKPRSE
jgi:hypothetical protein